MLFFLSPVLEKIIANRVGSTNHYQTNIFLLKRMIAMTMKYALCTVFNVKIRKVLSILLKNLNFERSNVKIRIGSQIAENIVVLNTIEFHLCLTSIES